jgi:hypothetical protein
MGKRKPNFEEQKAQKEEQKALDFIEQLAAQGMLKEMASIPKNENKGEEVTLIKEWTHPCGRLKQVGSKLIVDLALKKELEQGKFI